MLFLFYIFLHKTLLVVLSVRITFVVDMILALLSAGAAVGFKLDSLSKLSDTRAANSKMTLMHYLCKVNDNQKEQDLVSDEGYYKNWSGSGEIHNPETLIFLFPGPCFKGISSTGFPQGS